MGEISGERSGYGAGDLLAQVKAARALEAQAKSRGRAVLLAAARAPSAPEAAMVV
ncbi:hypothetical protein [Actinacidiphila glaucinigra]|uniref:hypothetical protein n=1 Tax=Actinacidiphila glaucinigra TaxID=235986 RepID=UPI0035D9DA9A